MTDKTVQCPNCNANISLTGALTAEIHEHYRSEYKKAVSAKENEINILRNTLGKEKLEIEKQRAELNRIVLERIQNEKIGWEKKVREDISNQSKVEMEDLKNQLNEKTKRIIEAQKIELELRKKGRELAEKEQALELELQRKFDEEKIKIEEATARKITESLRLKTAEKDKQLEDMRRQIEDLKRKAEQGSQQVQGEILELEVEAVLESLFPMDGIEPVPKGMRGGDIVHKVIMPGGQIAGTIIWETKRTKSWSDAWIEKLKGDQREIAAECSVIVTQVMPKDMGPLAWMDGVWVVDFLTFKGIAVALRSHLIQLFHVRALSIGKGEKMDFLYNYLTGTQFKHRIEAIVEAFQTMQMDLEKEKRAIQKSWAVREQQITKVMSSTVGMYGDIQGIVGSSLPKIAQLELTEESESLVEGITD